MPNFYMNEKQIFLCTIFSVYLQNTFVSFNIILKKIIVLRPTGFKFTKHQQIIHIYRLYI